GVPPPPPPRSGPRAGACRHSCSSGHAIRAERRRRRSSWRFLRGFVAEATDPELELLVGLLRVAMIAPGEGRNRSLERRIAAAAPELVQRAVIRGAVRMIRRADDRAEGRPVPAEPARMFL